MRQRLVIASFLFLLLVPGAVFAQTRICKGATCGVKEVGAFMVGITAECGNRGDCTLEDIMRVFHNLGNWILGIVGSLVLLMYVIGGIYFLTAQGDQAKVTKGKQYLKTSTLGLFIVLFAYLGIQTLTSVLENKGSLSEGGIIVQCGPGSFNAGKACGLNKRCTNDGQCLDLCTINHQTANTTGALPTDEDGESTPGASGVWQCTNKNGADLSSNQDIVGTCTPNLCPGDVNFQCCLVRTITPAQ